LDQQWRNDIPLIYEGLQNVWDVALLWDSDGTIRCSAFWQDNKQQARFYSGGCLGTSDNYYAPIFYGGEALASYIEKLEYDREERSHKPFLVEVVDEPPIYDGFNVVAQHEKVIELNPRYNSVVQALLNDVAQELKVQKLVSILDLPDSDPKNEDKFLRATYGSRHLVFQLSWLLKDNDPEYIELGSIRKFKRFVKLCEFVNSTNDTLMKFSQYHFPESVTLSDLHCQIC